MLTMMTAMALAAAAPATPAANAHAQPMQMGQMGQMDHSKMGHMNMAQHAEVCCKQTADSKMECAMPGKAGSETAHQGHNGR